MSKLMLLIFDLNTCNALASNLGVIFMRSKAVSQVTKRRRSIVVSARHYMVPSACILDFYHLIMGWRKTHGVHFSKSKCR